jgi:hypothetical protein
VNTAWDGRTAARNAGADEVPLPWCGTRSTSARRGAGWRAKRLRPGRDALDVELEAHAALERLRQARDDASERHVAALPGRVEPVREAEFGCRGRPRVAAAEASGQREDGGERTDPRWGGAAQYERGNEAGSERCNGQPAGQSRLLLQEPDAERERENPESHGGPVFFSPLQRARMLGG